VVLTTHPQLAPGSRMSRAIPLLPLWAFMACYRENFTLLFVVGFVCPAVVCFLFNVVVSHHMKQTTDNRQRLMTEENSNFVALFIFNHKKKNDENIHPSKQSHYYSELIY
jgi:hypothetical protein